MVTINDINRAFDNAITNISIKCGRSGTTASSGVVYGQGEAPRYELNDGKLDKELLNQIADDMAERWGLEVSIDEKGKREVSKTKFSLWDDKHQTVILLNRMVKYQDLIDFTNNGNGKYNLDDVLRYYTELDDIVKDKTGGVIFQNTNGASYNTIYDGMYHIFNPIVISNMVYSSVPEYNMKQVMGHEGGHASERTLTQEQRDVLVKASVGRNKYRKSNLTTDAERQIYDGMIFGTEGGVGNVSHTQTYSDAMENNNVKYASGYSARRHYANSRLEEDFAETMSAVSYRNLKDKSGFQITYSTGETVGYDKFVEDHKATFKVCCDFADGKLNL